MAAVLEFRLTGGSSNNDPNDSLGGATSSNTLSSTPLNNLFDNVTPSEAAAGDEEYRAIDIWNNGDATAENVSVYMSTTTSSPDSELQFAKESPDNTHDGSDQGDTVADESTAPSDVTTFSQYTSSSKLSLPNIPASEGCRLWIKRVISSGADNTPNDQGTITVEYA